MGSKDPSDGYCCPLWSHDCKPSRKQGYLGGATWPVTATYSTNTALHAPKSVHAPKSSNQASQSPTHTACQTLCACICIGASHLEPRHLGIPGCKALRMLGCHASGGPVGAAEHYGAGDLPRRHVVVLGGRVDYLVNGLHGEVEGHELYNGPQALEGRSHTNACEPSLHTKHICFR